MPKSKNGKISLNLKVSEEMYNEWVSTAAALKILNMSEFIRIMVAEGMKKYHAQTN